MQWTHAFYRQITANPFSTGWVPGRLVSIILSCYRLLQLPTAREGFVNNPKQAVKHPWTTRELIHPWTIRETSVLETQKNGLETWKTDFVPWATRETPVKQPWSTREWSGDVHWTYINEQIASIFAGSQYQIQSAIALFLKTTHVCMNQVSLKTDSKQWWYWSVDSKWLESERFREVIGERNFKWSS